MIPNSLVPFVMLVGIYQGHLLLNELWEICRVPYSENYSYEYKADQTLFLRILLRGQARYVPAYSYIYQSDLSSCG